MAASCRVFGAQHQELVRSGFLILLTLNDAGDASAVVESLRRSERPATAAVTLVPDAADDRGTLRERLARVEGFGDELARRIDEDESVVIGSGSQVASRRG